jgi:DNA-binding winged helix-turn-helix (wHTH) protein
MTRPPRPNYDYSWQAPDPFTAITVDPRFLTALLEWATWLEETLNTIAPDLLAQPETIDTGVLTVDLTDETATIDGQPLNLTPRQWQVLAILADARPQQLRSKDIAARLPAGPNTARQNVDENLAALRRILPAAGIYDPFNIRTGSGGGTTLAEKIIIVR